MLDEALLERAVRWLSEYWGEARLLAARRGFEEATGQIREGDNDYEWRIAHFFEHALCDDGSGPPPVAIFARELAASPEERTQLAGWLHSHRSLLRFEGWEPGSDAGRVRDLLLGGRYRFVPRPADRQLAVGDCFDGRIVPIGTTLHLSPGRVYHPQAAHQAIDTLLTELRGQRFEPAAVLNGLLRMRARFFQFESIRAEHVYRSDALAEPAFSAPWARHAQRSH